ncbi:gamma-glutamylcyclotransferase [Piscinibacter sp. XHJ-5]|uniref:gamma-glutamylcyclotransferase n=1 Tax=Piscinibacter sp. XHJ-5 TaxID=3037797 RepID=UPI002452EC51|nr:gamma-glutamylcyclotransferase [Piscinibacter sp. XHJ-5]
MTPHPPSHPRHPTNQLARIRAEWGGQADLWVFGYASLIWRPEFEAVEQRLATVYGWHRALEMLSNINRGTPECPGLVFALVAGGSCKGMAYRVDHARAHQELERLWLREMPTGVYDPRWLPCRTPQGMVNALAFTLSRNSPSYVGPVPDEKMIDILRRACGRYGTTLDYLVGTAASLRGCGIRDREIERLVALARDHSLTA